LSIPAIHLQAPVEEGTEDQELNVAVGHAPASVWPGAAGTSVFLAHDVSYFVHLDALKPGDVISYATACDTWRRASRTRPTPPWCSTPVGPRTHSSSPRSACSSTRPRWASRPGAGASTRAMRSSTRSRRPTTRPRRRRSSRPRASPSTRTTRRWGRCASSTPR
jgi:hypothetical protein